MRGLVFLLALVVPAMAQPVPVPILGAPDFIGRIASDASGNLYFTSNTSVYSWDRSSSALKLIASGNGAAGVIPVNNDTDFAGLALTPGGDIVYTERNRIQRIDVRTRTVSTISGGTAQGFSGDGGPATSAKLKFPTGLAFDAIGSLIVADSLNYRVRVVKAGSGVISTLAGRGPAGYEPTIGEPQALVALPSGDVVVSSPTLHQVLRISPTGTVTAFAGNGGAGSLGDGGPAVLASLERPLSLAVAANGDVYIGDFQHSTVRRVDAATGIITTVVRAGANSSIRGLTIVGNDLYILGWNKPDSGVGRLQLPAPPLETDPKITSVATNAGPSASGITLTPGGIFSIFGNRLSSPGAESFMLDENGWVPTTILGARVFVGNRPASILYASPSQINAIVPFGLPLTATTNIRIDTDHGSDSLAGISFEKAAPSVFAVANADGSVNSFDNPAPNGGTLVFYITGIGPMSPSPQDGSVPTLPIPLPTLLPIVATRGQVTYAGQAPGLVAGVQQVNVQVDPDVEGVWDMQITVGATPPFSSFPGYTFQKRIYLASSSKIQLTSVSTTPITGSTIPQLLTIQGANFGYFTELELYRNGVRYARFQQASSAGDGSLIYFVNFAGVAGEYSARAINPGAPPSEPFLFTVLTN